MCYYQLKLYMLCGHGEHSQEPIRRGPLCPLRAKEQCQTPETGSPISPIASKNSLPPQDESQKENKSPEPISDTKCSFKHAHPLRTYRIDKLCPACDEERWQRIAKFEIGVINDGVNRGFIKDRQKDRVEFHGRRLRTLNTGQQLRKASESEESAAETVLHDADSVLSLGGETLKEETTPEKVNATSSGRNSLVDASSMRRRSTLKSNVVAAGSVCTVENEKPAALSMATRMQAFFNS